MANSITVEGVDAAYEAVRVLEESSGEHRAPVVEGARVFGTFDGKGPDERVEGLIE